MTTKSLKVHNPVQYVSFSYFKIMPRRIENEYSANAGIEYVVETRDASGKVAYEYWEKRDILKLGNALLDMVKENE